MNRKILVFCFCAVLVLAVIPLGSAGWRDSNLIKGIVTARSWSQPDCLPELPYEDYGGIGCASLPSSEDVNSISAPGMSDIPPSGPPDEPASAQTENDGHAAAPLPETGTQAEHNNTGHHDGEQNSNQGSGNNNNPGHHAGSGNNGTNSAHNEPAGGADLSSNASTSPSAGSNNASGSDTPGHQGASADGGNSSSADAGSITE